MSAGGVTLVGDGPKRLPTGVYLIDAPCPRCGVIEEILVALRSALTITEGDTGSLRVKVRGKARDHDCQQARLTEVKS